MQLADRRHVPPLRIGVDVGGTKIAAVAVAPDGAAVSAFQIPTVRGVGLVPAIAAAVDGLLQQTGAIGDGTIGIGIPGIVDGRSRVREATHLGVRDIDLAAALEPVLRRSVIVENDVKAAALGASLLLRSHDLAYLGIGTGIAAGLVLDGELRRGAIGVAGEVGHLPLAGIRRQCPCGQTGCIETVASASAIADRWPGPIPAITMLDAAVAGDERAVEDRDAFLDGVALLVQLLLQTVDVDVVAIGGGLAGLGPRLADGVSERLDDAARASPFLASIAASRRVRLVPPARHPVAVGAAVIAAS